MTPLAGQPILTAGEMRATEAAAIDRGATVDSLMARAGHAVAAVVLRLASGSPVLVLCGPGNNGGDGYVVAAALAAAGLAVRVAATGAPMSDAAKNARAGWTGPVETLADVAPAPILVDALFGTGLSRALDSTASAALGRCVAAARLSIAVDLPSGVATDDGVLFGMVPAFDLTLTLGAAKPSHLLQPAASRCGQVRILDIGIAAESSVETLARPGLPPPGPQAHKYSRGMVAIVGGAMPGAAALAAEAALRSGAGYVLLLAEGGAQAPHAIVRRPFSPEALNDKRIGALVIGPGLGRDAEAEARLDHALGAPCPLVIDGDALHLLDDRRLALVRDRDAAVIMTPHSGEFDALFGAGTGSKIDRARAAADRAGATIVFKGADTVIAAPQGPVRLAGAGNPWLSTAGTGDVLAGAIGAVLAGQPEAPFEAACAGVWLHAEAARRIGAAFIADDLARALTAARASL
ncbi:NAD(P)H-hydrate dehydratase [Sphingomonas oligophenolica]|uniref:Bifunctional NAD(P)H-hydrate repair enzyme n=1 Tax=Sphingomonas oligophenolica TaxID=301154 RepID=A0ABU9Y5E6_9SPHN